MDKVLHKLLISCDVKDSWEHPPDADWSSSLAEVERLRPLLEDALGHQLRLDQDVQDASFFADLGVLVEQSAVDGSIWLCYEICFRFSWFSRLYTIHGNSWREFDIDTAMSLLKHAGYIYVPEESLHYPYDGVNVPFEAGLTWWVRYFDYL
jgi:hypothetical protein